MAIVTLDDISRMKDSVASIKQVPKGDDYHTSFEKKLHLKHISDERVSRWTDTLASKREAKLKWKKERADLEEGKRKEIDREEASLKNKLRDETIERAKALQYEEKERVKLLRSQQLYTEVIAAREQQVKEKIESQARMEEEEKIWHEKNLNMIREAERKDKEKMTLQKLKAMENARMLTRQRLENEAERQAEIQREKEEEAELIKKIRLDDIAAEQKAFFSKLEAKKKNKAEMTKLTNDIKEALDKKARRERQEAEIIQNEIERASFLANERVSLEKQHFKQRQETRKLLSDKAARDLEVRAAREVELFIRDQKIQESKERAKKEKEMQSKKEMEKLIDQSRQEQIKYKEKQKHEDSIQEILLSNFHKKMNQDQQERERKETEDRRKNNLRIRQSQERQIIMQREKRQKEKNEKEWNVAQELAAEDELFREFAIKEIEQFRLHGKKTVLLEKNDDSTKITSEFGSYSESLK